MVERRDERLDVREQRRPRWPNVVDRREPEQVRQEQRPEIAYARQSQTDPLSEA
jgi:hypothetical protein